MKYTKLIVAFLSLNLFLVFSMIFVANKTREIEKNNNGLKIDINKINEHIKINKIELITHKNSDYLNKIYSLYFPKVKKNITPNVVLLDTISKKQNLRVVKAKNN